MKLAGIVVAGLDSRIKSEDLGRHDKLIWHQLQKTASLRQIFIPGKRELLSQSTCRKGDTCWDCDSPPDPKFNVLYQYFNRLARLLL